MVWGFLIVLPGVLCQVASMAELASLQPIAGAQYHWTNHLAPPQYRRFITWLQGWVTWFSWIALLAGMANVTTNIILTLVVEQYPEYTAQKWHKVLIMWALLIVEGFVNHHLFRTIRWLELAAGLLHIILFVVFVGVLIGLGERHSADFVFFTKSDLSGWNDGFVSFNLGMVPITWGFVGKDVLHSHDRWLIVLRL